MRKIITTTFVTLDGVMQAPGGPEEDASDGFKYGGWQAVVPFDEMMRSVLTEFLETPFALLLGRKTYEIFASYWPVSKKAPAAVAKPFNSAEKYVVSAEAFEPAWQNSHCITGDVVAQLKKLKEGEGPDLWVHGSGNLIQTLLKEHLIDRMYVWIHPLTIGSGKRLFEEGTQAQKFKLIDSKVSSSGVILATYEPAGGFTPGRMDA